MARRSHTDDDTTDGAGTAGDAGESIDGAGGVVPKSTRAAESKRRRWRRRLVNAVAVLACIGTLVSVVAVWSHRLLLNTDAWVATVGPLAEDPAITDAVAVALTNEIFQLIQPEQRVKEALPEKAGFLAAPMSKAMHDFVEKETKELLATETFQNFWTEANRVVHNNAVALLRGETVAGFTATNGVVTVNILPLLSRTLQWLVEKAPDFIGERITVPVITQETPPDQARAELAAAFRVTVPPTFGVYTVFKSDDLAAAQTAVQLFDRLVYVIVIVTLALLIAAIALSPNRRRTLVGVGAGVILAMLLANALTQMTEKVILELIGGSQTRAAAEATINSLIFDLRTLTDALLVAGLVLIAVALVTGESRLARGLRAGVSRATGRASATLAGDKDSVLPALTTHAGLLEGAGVAVAAVGLFLIDATLGSVLAILLGLAIYELAIAVVTHTPDDDDDLVGDEPAVT